MQQFDVKFEDRVSADSEGADEKIYIPNAYLPWAELLMGAWEEAKDSAEFLVEGFWETYSPLDATALLFELLMAARGERLPHCPGERSLNQYHHNLTVALTAFYCLTLPKAEWVELVWEGA